jgi:hypothetical protein
MRTFSLGRVFRFMRGSPGQASGVTGLAYWEQRTRTYGARAVLNLGHPEHEADAWTRRQTEEIFPHLGRCLTGERTGGP